MIVSGTVNMLASVSVFTGIGRITINGGDPNLVDALGGAGTGQANLLLTMSVFDFVPSAQNLVADNLLYNSNYMVSISGTLIPLTRRRSCPSRPRHCCWAAASSYCSASRGGRVRTAA